MTGSARLSVVLLCCLIASVGASSARAFSEPDRFTQSAGAGGGGGRFFTGSPVDGYACSVCHESSTKAEVRVIGLPIDGYQPGQTYDVEINWDASTFPLGLHLELIGRDGHAAGDLALFPQESVDASGRCDGKLGNKVAAYERLPEGRKVLGVEPCGATNLKFRFTAPNLPDLAFAASIVRSDKSVSADGDSVLNLQRVLQRVGEPPRVTSDCALGARAPRGHSALWLLTGLSLSLSWRRLFARARNRARPAQRKSRPSEPVSSSASTLSRPMNSL